MTLRRPNYVHPAPPESAKSRELNWENENGIDVARAEDFPIIAEGEVDNGFWGDSDIFVGGYDLDEVFKLLQGQRVRVTVEWLP